MSAPRPASRKERLIEGSLHLLEGAAAFGLISGAALAAAFGKFLLGGLLGAFALGVLARLRGRAKKAPGAPEDGAAG